MLKAFRRRATPSPVNITSKRPVRSNSTNISTVTSAAYGVSPLPVLRVCVKAGPYLSGSGEASGRPSAAQLLQHLPLVFLHQAFAPFSPRHFDKLSLSVPVSLSSLVSSSSSSASSSPSKCFGHVTAPCPLCVRMGPLSVLACFLRGGLDSCGRFTLLTQTLNDVRQLRKVEQTEAGEKSCVVIIAR